MNHLYMAQKYKMKKNSKFSRLEVIEELEPIFTKGGNKQRKFLCRCVCGNKKEILMGSLLSGKTKSCGCLHKENKGREKKHGFRSNKINSAMKRTYETWRSMRRRCFDKKNKKKYILYGGRGITICKEWDEFLIFLKDMGERPIGKTLDRVNNDGNYCKENCRWATPKEQASNRRKRVIKSVSII